MQYSVDEKAPTC